MPMSLAASATLVGDAAFRYRVAMACYVVARNVLAGDGVTAGREQRVGFARSIIGQDYSQFLQYAALVAADPAIRGGAFTPATPPTDTQIQDAVTAMWNWLANVPAAPAS